MTIDEKIEEQLELAEVSEITGDRDGYYKHIAEIRRLTKQKGAK